MVKGDALTLTCGLTDLGRPAVNRYVWKLDDKEVRHVTTYNWTINPVQVWSLSILYSVSFCKEIIDFPGGQIYDPFREILFSSVPPSNSLVSVSNP